MGLAGRGDWRGEALLALQISSCGIRHWCCTEPVLAPEGVWQGELGRESDPPIRDPSWLILHFARVLRICQPFASIDEMSSLSQSAEEINEHRPMPLRREGVEKGEGAPREGIWTEERALWELGQQGTM